MDAGELDNEMVTDELENEMVDQVNTSVDLSKPVVYPPAMAKVYS